jgi:segregation and condensation protein B
MNLNEPRELAALLEAFLLASGKPQGLDRLYELFEEGERPEPPVFKKALDLLRKSCDNRAFELVEVASGYRLQIREKYAPWVGRLWEERPQRYSRAMLETLALIAYRQPITRGEIEDVRGVAVNSNIVKTLLEREWIRVVGYRDVPGKPAMFATTKAFLDHFNLKNLDDLPPLAALREMEPEPLPDVEDAPVPAHLQALADASLEDEDEAAPRDETSFRTLLLELDEMEQGLKTDFDDLRVEEVQANPDEPNPDEPNPEDSGAGERRADHPGAEEPGLAVAPGADTDNNVEPDPPEVRAPVNVIGDSPAIFAEHRASVAAAREALKALYQQTLERSSADQDEDDQDEDEPDDPARV